MSSEQIGVGLEVLAGVIVVPWVVFVTVSIFGIKSQLALIHFKLDMIPGMPKAKRRR
jgi:hypothetical protein